MGLCGKVIESSVNELAGAFDGFDCESNNTNDQLLELLICSSSPCASVAFFGASQIEFIYFIF